MPIIILTAPRIPPRAPWWERLWRFVGMTLGSLGAWHRLHVGCRMASRRVREFHKLLLDDLGGTWGLSELAKTRFIGPVGVWEAHNSRSVVPVGVWRPPGMLWSHDLSCLSVLGGLPWGYEGFRTTFGPPNRWGFGARPSKIFRSSDVQKAPSLTRRVRFARRIIILIIIISLFLCLLLLLPWLYYYYHYHYY